MSNFVASNGVVLDKRGFVIDKKPWFGEGEVHEARKEFYQQLRDKELGRWRDPEAPNFVVYPASAVGDNGENYHEHYCLVIDEEDGVSYLYGSDLSQCAGEPHKESARRYFAAHPEPKPWHDAKPGEVWEITYRSPRGSEISNRVMTCVDDGGNISFFNEYRLHTVNYTGIESARRIWPENEVERVKN